MRILYGVTGEGMGHATRSRVILEHLLLRNHEIVVAVSGRAHKFLAERFRDRPGIRFHEIHGLHLKYDGNRLDVDASIWSNLRAGIQGLAKNVEAYFNFDFEPTVVISDFESWAYLFGVNHFLPVISIDNMQIIDRCEHDPAFTDSESFRLAKTAVQIKLPGAHHYLITTFFHPPVRKERTTLIPPILRPEILAAQREPGAHVLVYQTATSNQSLIPLLQSLPWEFRVYGLGREGVEGNVKLRAFSEAGFIEDLRTARAVLAGGGFSLMSEAVHLRVPMFSVPLEQHFEQTLNALYLHQLGYGVCARRFEAEAIGDFLRTAPAVTDYKPCDNAETFARVDELLAGIAGGGA